MPTLEEQAAVARLEINRQARAQRAQVRAEAERALRQEPRAVEVGHTVAVIGTPQTYTKEVRSWQEEQFAAIAEAQRKSNIKLAEAVKEAQKPQLVTYEGITSEEQKILDEGYGVDEINRRRELATQQEYEAQSAAAQKEFEKDNVLVASNQWVSKEEYNKLSSEDKKLIQQIGINQFNAQKDREYQAALAEEKAFKAANIEIKPDTWIDKSWWYSLTLDQQQSAKVDEVTGEVTVTTTAPGEQVYEIEIASGEKIEVPAAEWEGMNEFEKLTKYLGRAPDYYEMQGLVRDPTELVYSGGKLIRKAYENVPVMRTIMGAYVSIFDRLRLAAEIVLPGIQSPQEAYWQETKPEAARLKLQYENMMYPDVGKSRVPTVMVTQPGIYGKIFGPTPDSSKVNWAIPNKYQAQLWRGTMSAFESELGLGAIVRQSSPLVTFKDITGEQWKQTGISVALLAAPLIFKGVSSLGRHIIRPLEPLNMLRPYIRFTKPVTVKVDVQFPIGFRKFTMVSIGKRSLLLPVESYSRLPIKNLKVYFRRPISAGFGTGLESSGVPKILSKLAFESSDALKALRVAERTIKGVKSTSPLYQELGYNLKQAQFAVQAFDSKFLHGLGDWSKSLARTGQSMSLKQVKLISKVTGFEGLEGAAKALAKATKVRQSTYSLVTDAQRSLKLADNLVQAKVWQYSLRRATSAYRVAKRSWVQAQREFSSKLQPRYGELLPKVEPKLPSAPPDIVYSGYKPTGAWFEQKPTTPTTPIEEASLGGFGLTPTEQAMLKYKPPPSDVLQKMRDIQAASRGRFEADLGTAAPGAFKVKPGTFKPPASTSPTNYLGEYLGPGAGEALGLAESPIMTVARSTGPKVAVAEPVVGTLSDQLTQLIKLQTQYAAQQKLATVQGLYTPYIPGPSGSIVIVPTPAFEIASAGGFPFSLGGGLGLAGLTSRMALSEEIVPDIELIPGYAEVVSESGLRVQRALSPLILPSVIPGTFTRQATWLSPSQLQAVWQSPSEMLLRSTNLQNLLRTNLQTGIFQKTGLEQLIGLQVESMTKLQQQLQTATKVKTSTTIATKTSLSTQLTTKIGITPKFFFPWLPKGEGKEKKKKKPWELSGLLLEPYPGMYPGLILHFPTPLEPVRDITRPRPVIKKTRITLRRRGTYAVAGFREVR